MPLEISEEVVALAYQSPGYYVSQGLRRGRRELDLLAIRLGEDGQVAERLRGEVSISTNPAGVLCRGPKKGTSKRPEECAKEWAEAKFAEPAEEAGKALKSDEYKRVFVYGRVNSRAQLAALESEGIRCEAIGDLVRRALGEGAPNARHRLVGIAELLTQDLRNEAAR